MELTLITPTSLSDWLIECACVHVCVWVYPDCQGKDTASTEPGTETDAALYRRSVTLLVKTCGGGGGGAHR